MINNDLLYDSALKTVADRALHMIVNECFINALPFDSSKIPVKTKLGLTDYTMKVMESIGGMNALESAIANQTVPAKRRLLESIYDICTESAKEVAERVTKDVDDDSSKDDISITMTESEMKSFTKKTGEIDTDKISECIKMKTKHVLQTEKEKYEEEESINEELSDLLKSDDETEDIGSKDANESYIDLFKSIALESDSPRTYISLFSRLQENAFEQLTHFNKKEFGDEDEITLLNKITFESFLPEFKQEPDIISALESAIVMENTVDTDALSPQTKSKIGTTVAVLIYTLMETLNTLNIYSPEGASIEEFVNTNVKNLASKRISNLYYQVNDYIDNLAQKIKFSKDNNVIQVCFDKLTNIDALLTNPLYTEEASDQAFRMELLNKVERLLVQINTINQNRLNTIRNTPIQEEVVTKHDISELDRICNIMKQVPAISEVKCYFDPTKSTQLINVVGVDRFGTNLKSSYMEIKSPLNGEKAFERLKQICTESSAMTLGRPIVLYMADGSLNKYNLNGN